MDRHLKQTLGIRILPGHEQAARNGTLQYETIAQYSGHQECICDICWGHIKSGTPLYVMPCRHAYHEDCIQQWFESQQGPHLCPNCKQPDSTVTPQEYRKRTWPITEIYRRYPDEVEELKIQNPEQHPVLYHLLREGFQPYLITKPQEYPDDSDISIYFRWDVPFSDWKLVFHLDTFLYSPNYPYQNQYASFHMLLCKEDLRHGDIFTEWSFAGDGEIHVTDVLEYLKIINKEIKELCSKPSDYQIAHTRNWMISIMNFFLYHKIWKHDESTDTVEQKQKHYTIME